MFICISTSVPLVNIVPSNDVPGCVAGVSNCDGWCQSKYTVSGLTGMAAEDSLGLAVTDLTAGGATFVATGNWNKDAGSFEVFYRGNTQVRET